MLGLCIMIAGVALLGCSDATVYTLYRNSVVIENARLHVATFDTADGSHTTARTAKQLVTCFSSSRASRRVFGARKEDSASDLPSACLAIPPAVRREAEEDWSR